VVWGAIRAVCTFLARAGRALYNSNHDLFVVGRITVGGNFHGGLFGHAQQLHGNRGVVGPSAFAKSLLRNYFHRLRNLPFTPLKKLAVIGDPISHSKSPRMQQAAIDALGLPASYEALLIPSQKISQIKKYQKQGYSGFNVTIPHKQTILNYCDRLTPVARAVGAVNTFYLSGKHWVGDNTDVGGFVLALKDMAAVKRSHSALVFGAGGASLAIVYAFLKLKVEKIYVCNRSKDKALALQKKFKSRRIEVIDWDQAQIQKAMSVVSWVVNTTALGLGDLKNQSPVAHAKSFRRDQVAIDLVYGLQPTKFLKQARKMGAATQNGLPMLLYQGVLSFERFFKTKPPIAVMRKALGL
jgi:shikimate dehydrogenase